MLNQDNRQYSTTNNVQKLKRYHLIYEIVDQQLNKAGGVE